MEGVNQLLSGLGKQCGAQCTVHDLRRTYATYLERLDVSAHAIKALLGHSSGRDVTGRHYAVIDLERLRRPAQALEDFILREAGLLAPAQVITMPTQRLGPEETRDAA